MAGSSGIQLKEVHVRMSGTASNRNYGNLSPEVKLIFIVEGLENWSEGLQQMVNTTHEAFEHAALALVPDFGSIGSGMLHELGIKPTTSISIHGVVPLGDDGALTFEELFELANSSDDDDYDPDFDDDDFGDEDSDGDAALEDDFDDDEGDTREVDTSHLTGLNS